MKLQVTGFTALLLLCCSCGAYVLDTAQTDLRTSFASGDYNSTAQLIESFQEKEVYKSKDDVLLYLEQGTVNHFAGNYQESSNYFTTAEDRIDDLFTKSVSRAVRSFVVNDNTLAYDGEDYEDIYINVFKSLNYVHQNELQSALVEARRVSYKLDRLNIKYNGLIESLSKADSTNTDNDKWKAGKSNFQNSALANYLSTILFAKTNKPDDARIEYTNLLKAFQGQPSIYTFQTPDKDDLKHLTRSETYNVLINAFSGRAPVKNQNDIRFYHEESDTYLKFSLPTLEIYKSQVRSIEMVVNDTDVYSIPLIEEMDIVAQEVYKVKEPIIYARTMVRTVMKAVASNKLKNAAKKENETLGLFVNALGKIAQETTEKADLRSWQTMPGKAYANVILLPPGEHNININYYNSVGTLLYTDRQTLPLTGNENLKLIESIYWN
ncbi:MAG: hypothetical protein WD059_01940 [Balneolaceae bacterium]